MSTAHQLAKVFIVEDNPDDISMADMLMQRNRVRTDFTYFVVHSKKPGATAYLTRPLNLGSLKTIVRHVNNLNLVEESAAHYFVRTMSG